MTIVEMLDRILPVEHEEASVFFEKDFTRRDVAILKSDLTPRFNLVNSVTRRQPSESSPAPKNRP